MSLPNLLPCRYPLHLAFEPWSNILQTVLRNLSVHGHFNLAGPHLRHQRGRSQTRADSLPRQKLFSASVG